MYIETNQGEMRSAAHATDGRPCLLLCIQFSTQFMYVACEVPGERPNSITFAIFSLNLILLRERKQLTAQRMRRSAFEATRRSSDDRRPRERNDMMKCQLAAGRYVCVNERRRWDEVIYCRHLNGDRALFALRPMPINMSSLMRVRRDHGFWHIHPRSLRYTLWLFSMIYSLVVNVRWSRPNHITHN